MGLKHSRSDYTTCVQLRFRNKANMEKVREFLNFMYVEYKQTSADAVAITVR